MACFIVSAAEAVVVTAMKKSAEKKEKNEVKAPGAIRGEDNKIPFSRKLKWLTYMLWGGAILLFFEHVWHGEIVPWFPFLTAASNSADAAVMIREMATVGVCMAILITVIWFAICKVADSIIKRNIVANEQDETI